MGRGLPGCPLLLARLKQMGAGAFSAGSALLRKVKPTAEWSGALWE